MEIKKFPGLAERSGAGKMKKFERAFSLIEILVVLSILGIVIAVSSQILISTLKGKAKSEATARIKTEGNYIISVMEREIHSAQSVSQCGISNQDYTISYTNKTGSPASFTCRSRSDGGYDVVFNGQNLNSSGIKASTCQLTCLPPQNRTIDVSMQFTQVNAASLKPEDRAQVDFKTRIIVRNE